MSTPVRSGQFSVSGPETHSCQCPGCKASGDWLTCDRDRHPNATLLIYNEKVNAHMDQNTLIGIISAFLLEVKAKRGKFILRRYFTNLPREISVVGSETLTSICSVHFLPGDSLHGSQIIIRTLLSNKNKNRYGNIWNWTKTPYGKQNIGLQRCPHPNSQNLWIYYLMWQKGPSRSDYIKDLEMGKLSWIIEVSPI